jgi:pathogenesis-related protein 1
MESGSSSTGSGDRAVQAWASEASGYNWDTNSCANVCSHYPQLVWAATTSIGCGC